MLTDGAATTYDATFPVVETICLADGRGSFTSNFTYEVDLTPESGWEVVAATDYTCSHTYLASNP